MKPFLLSARLSILYFPVSTEKSVLQDKVFRNRRRKVNNTFQLMTTSPLKYWLKNGPTL